MVNKTWLFVLLAAMSINAPLAIADKDKKSDKSSKGHKIDVAVTEAFTQGSTGSEVLVIRGNDLCEIKKKSSQVVTLGTRSSSQALTVLSCSNGEIQASMPDDLNVATYTLTVDNSSGKSTKSADDKYVDEFDFTYGSADAVDLASETSAREQADSALDERDDVEAAARAAADSDESASRAAADAALQDGIDAEEGARQTADAALDAALLAESQARAASDTAEAVAREAADIAEAVAREAGDETEATARIAADDAEEAARMASLSAEEAARIAEDLQLQSNISANTDAIRSNAVLLGQLQNDISAVSASLTQVENQVSQNTSDIASTSASVANLEGDLNGLSGQVGVIASDLFDLKTQHENDVASLQDQIDDLQGQIDGLTLALNGLTNQLVIELAALADAIEANSDSIGSLTTTVTLLSGQVSIAQTDIINLQNRTISLENSVGDLEVAVQELADDLSVLQGRVAILQGWHPQEYVLIDTPDDDTDGSDFRAFMEGASTTSDGFIYVEGNGGQSGALCATNAQWYVDNYVSSSNTSSTSGSWDKWGKRDSNSWSQDNGAFTSYYGSACGGGWCPEWGLGGNTIGFLPSSVFGDGGEAYNSGGSGGNGSFIVRIADTRMASCGF